MKKKLLGVVLFLTLAFIGYRVLATTGATIVNGGGTPFAIFTVATNADTAISLPDNDILFLHTGLQADGTTASVAGDYIVVMNAFTGDGTTGTSMSADYSAGAKLNIPTGTAFTFRGVDTSYGSVLKSNQVIVRAVGHGATIQIVKGSQYGSSK